MSLFWEDIIQCIIVPNNKASQYMGEKRDKYKVRNRQVHYHIEINILSVSTYFKRQTSEIVELTKMELN